MPDATVPSKKRTLIQGGRVLIPATETGQVDIDAVQDVLICDGVIEAIGPNLAETHDGTAIDEMIVLSPHHWVAPGLVDIHVHFRDPGQTHKESIQTGANAAAAGGFTTVCMMPNTQPALDSASVLDYVQQAARQTGITIYAVPGVSKNLEGKELTAMGTLSQKGAVAFSDDGYPIENANLMRKALEYSKMFNKPIVCHAEDSNLCGCGVMHEGYHSTRLGLPGIPSAAESVMVARDIELARITGGHVHFAHLSSRESVALVRQAKAENLNITAETTPHNLTLTDASLETYDPNFKMYGPLRSEADRQALLVGIKDGTIDAIATDHAPHSPEEKQWTMMDAPRGVIGLETSLGAILTYCYHTGHLTPIEVICLMSSGPAQCYHLPEAGNLSVGRPADVVIIDPDLSWTVDPTEFKSKSRNCPFNGQTFFGKAVQTFAAGQRVYHQPHPDIREIQKDQLLTSSL